LYVGTKVFEVAFSPEVDPEVEIAGCTTTCTKLPKGDFYHMEGVNLIWTLCTASLVGSEPNFSGSVI
jgi:hypothetical protein